MNQLQTIRQNISKKYTVLPLLYTYGNNHDYALAIFYDLNQYDEDSEMIAELPKQAIETMVSYYSREDVNALISITQFLPDNSYSVAANTIQEYWTIKVTNYLEDYKDYNNTLETDRYFFMFLPKSL